jgi:hypothetical protein
MSHSSDHGSDAGDFAFVHRLTQNNVSPPGLRRHETFVHWCDRLSKLPSHGIAVTPAPREIPVHPALQPQIRRAMNMDSQIEHAPKAWPP